MKRISNIPLFAALLPFLALYACGEKPVIIPPEPIDEVKADTVVYTASDEIFPNPERGFYSAAEVHSADGKGVAQASIKAARLQAKTLFLLEFHLTDYVNCDIADEYLATIRAKFESLREGGVKCILRFCYSNGMDEKDKPWDATPEQVLRHVAQVKPLIREYADVIMVVQAGFIGSWGEWYYTENFTSMASRKELMDVLLDAVPADRQIELRTPAYKMKLYGFSKADTITRATAHQPTPQARLGGHNDCYVSSSNDVGTFNSNNERNYWGSESLYTIMGGESCALTEYCHCEGTEKYRGALKDLAFNHMTYLNSGYHQQVLKRWKDEGCMDEIKRRLGYRYVLEEGIFPKTPKAGDTFSFTLKLRNDGFAPVQNQRDAELVLCDASGKAVKTWPLDSDPRYWMPAQQTVIQQDIVLPDNISGTMTLYLNLPDHSPKLHDNPLYSIRLANEGTWMEDTGYNKLYTFNL